MAMYGHAGTPIDPTVVYVGNIAWEVDPDTIRNMLAEFGAVTEFAMLPDPMGGRRHRGSGAARFLDAGGAAAAIAGVNGRLLAGRAIRVAILDPDSRGAAEALAAMSRVGAGYAPQQHMAPLGAAVRASAAVAASGTELPPGIRGVVGKLTLSEAWDVIREMKQLADEDEAGALALLAQYPSLSIALTMLHERLALLKEVPQDLAPAVPGIAMAGSAPPAGPAGMRAPLLRAPLAPQSGVLGAPGRVDARAGAAPMPGGYAAAPAVAAYSAGGVAAAPAPADEDTQATALIQAILMMTDADVASMPADQRDSAQMVRDAVTTPLAKLRATQPPDRFAELMQLREQLTGMGFHVAP